MCCPRGFRQVEHELPREGRITIEIRRALSQAFVSIGHGPVDRGGVNCLAWSGRQLQAVISIDGMTSAWQLELTRHPEGRVGTSVTLRAQLDEREWEGISRPRGAIARIRAGGAEQSCPLLLLPPWHWPIDTSTYAPLASMVLPQDGLVRMIVALARSGSHRRDSADVIAARPPLGDFGMETAGRLYNHLVSGTEISYVEPAPESIDGEDKWQVIRPPHRILLDAINYRGEGNCIDLSLFFAGLLEYDRVPATIILVRAPDGTPVHALPGYWRDGGRRFRPIVDSTEEIQDACRAGRLSAIEITAVCVGRGVSFQNALDLGAEKVSNAANLLLVDVGALRPPSGTVAPLQHRFDQAVVAALEASAAIAIRSGTNLLQTVHLLAGLLSARGEITARLLFESATDLDLLNQKLGEELSRHSDTSKRGRTRGYDRALSDARDSANALGLTTARESDLWWAILRAQNETVSRVLVRAGSSIHSLSLALVKISPDPRPESGTY